ncbi:MAG: mechanosensitive ion channel family protein [Gammaproteobacteria bacterium]|nr:mechanosensitive ion channel family protein [Gammaproteobacteria bacterium]
MNSCIPNARLLSFLGALLMLALPAHAQDAPDLGRIAELIRWGGVAASIPVVIGALFLIRLVENVGDRLSTQFSNRRPTIQKVQTTARFFIYIATLLVAGGLSVRLDSTALTVIGGALAFSIGFALRDLVASFIAGITIMFDRPFQVGDRVSYGGEYGDIITIGLRSVRMNTLDHNIITIPNNKVFTDVTSSGNYGALEMQVPMDFYIGVDQDAKLAAEVIREACLTSPYIYLDEPVPVLVKQLILQDYVAINLKVRPYVFDCKYEKPFETDVHFRVLEAFREHGIGSPAVLHRSVGPAAKAENR